MNAEVIAIGSELTTGAKLDTNSQWLSLELADLGISVTYHTTVADDMAANGAVLKVAAERADLVIITGGLGPTLDDLTRQVLAELAGVELVLDEASLHWIETYFRNRHRPMPDRNRVQALFPRGAVPLPNPIGTAPGVWMELPRAGRTNCLIAAMPGVPSEMFRMYREQVRSRLPRGEMLLRRARINCFGLGESQAEELLGDLTARGRDPEIGITAHEATITLRILAAGANEAECQEKIDAASTEIRQKLGQAVFGVEDEELEDDLLRQLQSHHQTLAVVEAGTQGVLTSRLAQAMARLTKSQPQMSAQPTLFPSLFLGGVVLSGPDSWSSWRDPLLTQPTSNATNLNLFQEDILHRATHTRQLLRADYALAVGPFPEVAADALAQGTFTAQMAVVGEGVAVTHSIAVGGNPAILSSRVAKAAVDLLRRHLLGA